MNLSINTSSEVATQCKKTTTKTIVDPGVVTENDITSDGIELLDYCYNEGKLIGTAMSKQVTFTIKNTNNYHL